MLSGPSWCSLYPTSTSTDDLAEPFRTSCQRFLDALHAAGAMVTIEATRRPWERASLMNWAWRVAREGFDPRDVPAIQSVDIQWDHGTHEASRAAAEAMVQGYGIVFKPALTSRHIEGKAIDMDVKWTKDTLVVVNGSGNSIWIPGEPRNNGHQYLQQVGASYGVYKLASDPPHWSADGH